MPILAPDRITFDANKTQGLDLLGLRAPVQAIGNELLNGLTSVTPKLRYLSVLSWVIWRYAEARLPDDWTAFREFAAAQEAVIVMAKVLRDRTTLNLVGVGKAGDLLDSGIRPLGNKWPTPSRWQSHCRCRSALYRRSPFGTARRCASQRSTFMPRCPPIGSRPLATR
jgi:hypothetical protein